MARLLDNWLKAYMRYTRHLEAPDPMHFWSGVAAIAGALRGKVWVDMGYWKWKPNFFIIFVAPPGIATKSTTIANAMSLLREVPDIHFGPDSATWQAVTDSFIEAIEIVKYENESHSMACITLAVSELGTFLDPRNREMVDVLVDLWDGRPVPWKRRTKGEGLLEIPSPWLNFVGATTPSWITENFPQYAVTGGFTSRTIFIFADRKRHFVAYPQLRISQEDRALRLKLIHDLIEISKIVGEYEITEEAFEWGESWYQEHWEKRPSHSADDRLSGYLARKQTHVHKVAVTLSAAHSDVRHITLEDLQAAESIVTGIEAEMQRVFEGISDSGPGRHTQLLLTALKLTSGGLTKQQLWQKFVTHMAHEEFEAALKGLVMAGWCKQYKDGEYVKLRFHQPTITPKPEEETKDGDT